MKCPPTKDELAKKIASQILKTQSETANKLNAFLNSRAKRTLNAVLVSLALLVAFYCIYLIITAFIHL